MIWIAVLDIMVLSPVVDSVPDSQYDHSSIYTTTHEC